MGKITRLLSGIGAVTGIQLTIYLLYRIIRTKYFSRLLKIPGLPYGPLYGNVRESMQGEAGASSLRWVRKYGGIVRFYHIFGQERLLVADPELVRHILVTNSSNYIRPKSQAISELANEGLLSLEGVLHRSERKLLNPAFNHSAIASFLPLFKRKATELIDEIERMVQTESTGDGVHVDMQRYIKSTTMDVIGLAGFDYDLSTIKHSDSELVRSIDLLISSQQASLLSNIPFYRLLPTRTNSEFKKAQRITNKVFYEIIERHRERPSTRSSIISLLLGARYDGGDQGLSDKALKDHVVTFMIAGHETSSMTLTWLMLELAKNPSMQDRLYDEVSHCSYDDLDIDTLESMKYLDACIREVSRLYPPVSAMTRTAANDDTMQGYDIPAGTQIIIHIGAMMKAYVDDGETFNPERFLSKQATKINWLPFGIGPHTCIGNKFAVVEMKLLLFYLIKKFKFSQVPGLTIRKKYRLLLRPIPNVQLIAQIR